jgi:hypothetical protein
MKYDNEELKDKSACAGVRADLKMCLLESDCCKLVSFDFENPKGFLKDFHQTSRYSKEKPPENVSTSKTAQFPANVKFLETHFSNASDQS